MCGFGTPEKPQRSESEQDTLSPVVEVALGHGQRMGVDAFWTLGMLCMQGT